MVHSQINDKHVGALSTKDILMIVVYIFYEVYHALLLRNCV